MTDHTGAWSVRAWDLVRATLCGTAALILVGTVVYQLTMRDQNRSEGLVGAVLVLAFIAAVAYRHLGALITSAAVVIMGGFAFLLGNHAVYVHLNRNSDIYLARSLDASPMLLLLLGSVLVGQAIGIAARRELVQSRLGQYGARQILIGLGLGLAAVLPLMAALDTDALRMGTMHLSLAVTVIVAGLVVGVLPAVSPAALVPPLVLLVLTVVTAEEDAWFAPALVLAQTVLAVVPCLGAFEATATRVFGPSLTERLAQETPESR